MGLAKLCGLSGWYFLLVNIFITVGCGAAGNQTARVTLQAQPPVTSDWKPDELPEEPEVSLGELLAIPELRPVSADNLISHGGYASLVKAEFRSTNQTEVMLDTTPLAQNESVVQTKGAQGSRPFAVSADVDGNLTDLFITLELPQPPTGAWYLKWAEGLSTDFFCQYYFNGGNLQLGIAGVREANQAFDVSLLSKDELVKLLSDRHSLSGKVPICTLAPGPQATAGWLEIKPPLKSVVAVDPVTQVTGVEVTAVNGEYEISWPARLLGDYDQNSEVGLSDITPLVMLYQLRNFYDSWALETFARTDGNGDGEINLTDITTIVMNYGHSLSQFRVEKASGNAVGPESAWTEVASVNRSSKTRYGDAIQSLGSPPYQRAGEAVAPGWTYYRVIGINRDGIEAVPSDAVLAPDATPPIWPAGDNIAEVEHQFETIVSFAEDATDDRGGLVSYILQVTGGEGDPGDLPIFGEWRDENVYNELTSPYSIHSFYLPPDFEDSFRFKFVIGAQYYVRVLCSDPSGNRQTGDWMGLVPDTGEIEDDGSVQAIGEWDLWVNKEGTIRFTPPQHFYKDGSTMEEYIYTDLLPEKEHSSHNYLYHFDPANRVPYTGGEVVWEYYLAKGQILYLAYVAIGTGGSEHFEHTYLKFPELWLKPFDGDFLPSPSRYQVDVYTLSNGTPYSIQYADWLGHYLIYFYGGASVYMDSLEGISDSTFDRNARSRPVLIPETSEILFHEPTNGTTPGSVTWWKRGQGITAKITEPPGVFSQGFSSSDFIDKWLMVDKDTFRGVRGEPVEQPDGSLAIELWEARRNGGMEVVDLLVPMELSKQFIVELVDNPAAKLAIGISSPTGGFGWEHFLALLSDDDEWTVIQEADVPSEINPSEWYSARGSGRFDFPTIDGITYRIYGTLRVISEDPAVTYAEVGVYSGNIFEGFSSFTKVWSSNSDQQLHPDYPIRGRLHLTFNSLTEATTYGDLDVYEGDLKSPMYYFNADGSLRDVIVRPPSNMLIGGGWDKYGNLSKLGNGLLSDDGVWLAPRKEGVWGYLYQINQ